MSLMFLLRVLKWIILLYEWELLRICALVVLMGQADNTGVRPLSPSSQIGL